MTPEGLTKSIESFFNLSTFFLVAGLVFVFLAPALAGLSWLLGWFASRVAIEGEKLLEETK